MHKKLFIFFFLILLSGCSQNVIKLDRDFSRLDPINKYNANYSNQKNDVQLALKKFTNQECTDFFGVDVVNCGYQPIQLTISNFTNEVIYLSPTNISLPLTSPKKVAKACHWRTAEIVTGVGLLSCVYLWPALIPTAYFGKKMKEENEEISRNIVKQDIIQCWDTISILPSENVSRIIFVDNHYFKNNFCISLVSAKDKTTEFQINLEN